MASSPTVLDEATARQLLEGAHAGRLAINDPDGPLVVPVNHTVVDGDVVIRSGEGTKLDAADEGAVASYQVDGIDAEHDRAWSVLARGRLERVDDEDEREALARRLRALPLAGGEHPYLVRLRVIDVTGRRLTPLGEPRTDTNTWFGRDGSDLLG